MTGRMYICPVCGGFLAGDDEVVQTILMERLRTHDGEVHTSARPGDWFHAGCWGQGVRPHREIDRGPLNEVVAR